ncbi:MAG: class I SAM-dependent methyltransferase [Roseovarius gahaiensis]
MTVQDQTPNGFFESDINMMANRMQARHAMLVDGFRHVIADSTVLLLGAEDGRWCYSFAAAGALQVVGVEPCSALVERFSRLPDIGLRERIDLRSADVLAEIIAEAHAGRRYDVVVLFDVLEGAAPLHDWFNAIMALHPRLVIGDGLFATTHDPIMALEKPRRPIHGATATRLIPSHGAIAMASRDAGFDLDWIDWGRLHDDGRLGLSDYYQNGSKSRGSFMLMPKNDPDRN